MCPHLTVSKEPNGTAGGDVAFAPQWTHDPLWTRGGPRLAWEPPVGVGAPGRRGSGSVGSGPPLLPVLACSVPLTPALTFVPISNGRKKKPPANFTSPADEDATRTGHTRGTPLNVLRRKNKGLLFGFLCRHGTQGNTLEPGEPAASPTPLWHLLRSPGSPQDTQAGRSSTLGHGVTFL